MCKYAQTALQINTLKEDAVTGLLCLYVESDVNSRTCFFLLFFLSFSKNLCWKSVLLVFAQAKTMQLEATTT